MTDKPGCGPVPMTSKIRIPSRSRSDESSGSACIFSFRRSDKAIRPKFVVYLFCLVTSLYSAAAWRIPGRIDIPLTVLPVRG